MKKCAVRSRFFTRRAGMVARRFAPLTRRAGMVARRFVIEARFLGLFARSTLDSDSKVPSPRPKRADERADVQPISDGTLLVAIEPLPWRAYDRQRPHDRLVAGALAQCARRRTRRGVSRAIQSRVAAS